MALKKLNENQQKLNDELDSIGTRDFTCEDIHKMTLWKVQRFPYIKPEALSSLNKLKSIKSLENEKDELLARTTLKQLLGCSGVRLPMASTYLRFRNPNVFQIIDRHVWYQVKHDEEYIYEKRRSDDERIDDYFSYLKELRALCEQDGKDFSNADSIYYWQDIDQGHKISNIK